MTERQYDILFFGVVILCAALIVVPALLSLRPPPPAECWHGRTVDTLLRTCE